MSLKKKKKHQQQQLTAVKHFKWKLQLYGLIHTAQCIPTVTPSRRVKLRRGREHVLHTQQTPSSSGSPCSVLGQNNSVWTGSSVKKNLWILLRCLKISNVLHLQQRMTSFGAPFAVSLFQRAFWKQKYLCKKIKIKKGKTKQTKKSKWAKRSDGLHPSYGFH